MNMLNPFVCGTFHDDEPLLPSPKKSKRKDNPYSSRGLDKFSELLADLDEKRQKIYSQMNPHDISFVRFVYSNTDDFVPVVVKVKNKDKDQNKHKNQEQHRVMRARTFTTSESMNKFSTESSNSEERKQQQTKLENVKKDDKFFSWNVKKLDIGKPSFYLPMIVVLILLFLTVFGKSVATLCTCILWYLIPTLKGDDSSNSSSSRSSMKKKDYGRRVGEKKVVVTNNEGTKKKDYDRWMSEKKMVVNEERTKKKDYVRGWSEKKMVVSEELIVSSTSGNSDASSKNKIQGKHSHKKSW